MMRSLLICLSILPVASVLVGCDEARIARERASTAITETDYRRHIEVLASDEFGGRAPGSEGERKTVEYLERQFLDLGLQPAADGSFRQYVPLVEITAALSDAHLRFSAGGGSLVSLAFGEDMVVGTRRVQREVSVEGSEVVFVGYGIVAPEYGWDDYAGLDMRGKTALILVNDPGFATGDTELFRGRTMTYYGRWTYKFEEAARQGAAAAIIVHETAPAAYPWAVVRNGWTGPQFYAETPDGNASRAAIEGWVTRDGAGRLLSLAGQDYEALKAAAKAGGFKPVPLDLTAAAGVRNVVRRARSPNVAGLLPGKERPDEYVVYMAHWDHLGQTLSMTGDTVMNGAADNATGVSGILTIARAFGALLSNPPRSVLFLAVTAEESGLIGSTFYVNNLTQAEQDRIALYLNFDMIGSPNYVFFVYDGDGSDSGDPGAPGSDQIEYLFEHYYTQAGQPFKAVSLAAKQSAHFPFNNAGVPVGGIFTGDSGIKTAEEVALWGGTAGDQYDPCYHLACDTFDNISLHALNVNAGAVAYAALHFAMTTEAINGKRGKGNFKPVYWGPQAIQ